MTPNRQINATELKFLIGEREIVYGWFRPSVGYLYIGCTSSGILRMLTHQAIGKYEPVQPNDVIHIWTEPQTPAEIASTSTYASSMLAFEAYLNHLHKPKYSMLPQLGRTKRKLTCPSCHKEFMQSRSWQKVCSKRCFTAAQVKPMKFA